MKNDVLVVSAFGRGHWMAAEMAVRGLSVHLVDVTDEMGRWTPEDWEGPFGLFFSEELTDLQRERLAEDDYLDPVECGFTLWLKGGALEMRDPLFPYRFQRQGYSAKLKEYLKMAKHQDRELIQSIQGMAFDKNWMAHLAHQLSSHIFLESPRGMDHGCPLPLLSPYCIRRVSRRGYAKGVNWVRSKGVEVTSGSVVDIFLERKGCRAVEISLESGELMAEASQFIWCLNSEESQFLSPKISEILFPQGCVSPQWNWLRYRVQLLLLYNHHVHSHTEADPELFQAIPIKFTMIDDIELPWTHTNLCMVQRTSKESDYDVWVRLPHFYCFKKDLLEEVSQEILDSFRRRLPHCAPKLLDMPQEHRYEEGDIGPGLFPVYDKKTLRKFKPSLIKNLHFDGSEVWDSLDWGGQFRSQGEILQKIYAFYKKYSLKNLKGEPVGGWSKEADHDCALHP